MLLVNYQPPSSGGSEAELLTWVGVGVSLIGALVAAPNAPLNLWHELIDLIRRMFRKIRRRRSTTAHAGTAGAMANAHGAHTTLVPRNLRRDLKDHRNETQEQFSRVRQELTANASKSEEGTTALKERLDREASEAARINARGLPLIGLGILLTGVPDKLASFLQGALGWLLAGAAIVFTVVAIFPAFDRTWLWVKRDRAR